jgi:tetratricopeptide (TPR) repeat protein
MLCALVLSSVSVPVQITIEEDTNPSNVVCEALAESSGSAGDQRMEPSVRIEHRELLEHLSIQAALREGIKLVGSKEYAEAIRRLEPVLAEAAGNDIFLETLEAAYRGQIASLIVQRDMNGARLLAERLRVLSPDAPTFSEAAEQLVAKASDSITPAGYSSPVGTSHVEAVTQIPVAAAASSNPQAADEPVVAAIMPAVKTSLARGKIDDRMEPAVSITATESKECATEDIEVIEDAEPVSSVQTAEKADASLLASADKLFEAKRYVEALPLYERAYETDPVGVQSGRERWGYCLLFVSVERYNQLIQEPSVSESAWKDLESDVQLARRLAPSLEYTDTVIKAIDARRRNESTAKEVATGRGGDKLDRYPAQSIEGTPTRSLRHLPGRSQSWSVAETRNFRIYHRDPALAEKVGQLAEEAREMAYQKWFPGEPHEDWSPICEVYLYPTAHEYGQETGVGPQSPGHSKVFQEPGSGRIVSRRLALRTDDPNMLEAVLPHETAHVVFAGRFGPSALPRWADEGMAVLTEPRDKQEGHLANLFRARQTSMGFSCTEILTMQDYPPGHRMRDFYAHSVGICRYLVELGGSQKLVEFLRTALQQNSYEQAMQQIYGLNMADFEQQFNQYVVSLGQGGSPVTTALR